MKARAVAIKETLSAEIVVVVVGRCCSRSAHDRQQARRRVNNQISMIDSHRVGRDSSGHRESERARSLFIGAPHLAVSALLFIGDWFASF